MYRPFKYYLVIFDDGYQSSIIAIDNPTAVHMADRFERQYRNVDHNRRIRKAVRASQMSDIPAIRSQQFRDIAAHNKALLDRQRRTARKR